MVAESRDDVRHAPASRRSLLRGTATGLLAGAGAMATAGVLARPQAAEAATVATPDWIDITAAPYDADPTGSDDSTSSIQAALTQVAANGGGVLYVPTGNYKITSSLAYDSGSPLMITGDGPQASNVRMASTSTSIDYLSITQTGSFGTELGDDGTVIIEKIAFYNDVYAGAFSDTNVAIKMNGVNFGQIQNVAFYKGTGTQRINQAIVLSACNQVDIDNANIFAAVNGIVVTGYSQVNNISNTSIWTPAGTGVSTAAAVLYLGKVLTANMESVIFHDGDRGILWTQDSDDNVPHLLFCYNVQPNNHAIAAMEIDYGAQVYLTECFFSASTATVDAEAPGLLLGSNFQGSAKVEGCQFNGITGHTISAQGGTGIVITGCEFGGGGKYKYAAGAYDEINVGASVAQVTIDSCHFNVDALSGLGTSNPPRSALYVASGAIAVTVSGSKGPGAGYGTAPIFDGGSAVMRNGNIGLGLADQTTGGGSTVTGTSPADLSASITVPAYDMTAGTVYRFTAFGHGSQASGTPVGIEPKINIGGISLGTFTPASNPAAGAAFNWAYTCYLAVTATGVSATIISNETFTWAGLVTSHGNDSFTVDTTESNAIVMTASWIATAGSPTITCDYTMLERVQNYPAS